MADAGVSAGEAGGIFAGIVTMLGLGGKGVHWWWSARRQAKSDYYTKMVEWEKRLVAREEDLKKDGEAIRGGLAERVEELERAREHEAQARAEEAAGHAKCQMQVQKLVMLLVPVIEEMQDIKPLSHTARRAKAYFMREFPEAFGPQPPVPPDMVETLDKIG